MMSLKSVIVQDPEFSNEFKFDFKNWTETESTKRNLTSLKY